MATTTEVKRINKSVKTHGCSWCGQSIKKGGAYDRYRYYDGGYASTVKMHPECLTACDQLVSEYNEPIEFNAGDYPRGCYCEFDCEKCSEVSDHE